MPAVTVLVVDDNAANRALAEAALGDEGYRVLLAEGGEAGVAAFEREHPDCVLLDVRMPDIDGPAACRRIRALPGGADVPIVFVTAQRDVDTFDRAQLAGGNDFLTKPYRPSELVARVAAALELRRLSTERRDLVDQIRRQRDDVQRLQLQKEELLAYVVHDLKNPVNAIDLQAQLILRDADAGSRAQRAGGRIRDESRVLLRRIGTILDLARADAGQLAPALQRVDLPAMIQQLTDELDLRAQGASVRLTPEVTAVEVGADPHLLHRVLENLVDNAIRHAPEGSEILITARPADGGVELRVQDRGRGVPAEQRERVFERYVTTGDTARVNRGLGLAFCKMAIDAHGGRIWIEDAAPGATFCAWIPS